MSSNGNLYADHNYNIIYVAPGSTGGFTFYRTPDLSKWKGKRIKVRSIKQWHKTFQEAEIALKLYAEKVGLRLIYDADGGTHEDL